MNAAEARRLLLVRAHEVGEPSADWRDADRAWASEQAWRIDGTGATAETWMIRRSELAAARLSERLPAVATWLAGRASGGLGTGLLMALLALALLTGLASAQLRADRQIQLLAPPLLGLLAWNLAVYLLLAAQALGGRGRQRRRTSPGPLQQTLLDWGARIGRRLGDHLGPPALQTAVQDWARLSLPLQTARLATAMHLAAGALAVGAVAGLYLRGLAHEYRAGWDSTFLDASAVHALLSVLLGPAAWLLEQPLPDVARLEALRFSRGPGEIAAPWIHLHALTLAGWVLLPRALLAAWAARRAHRLQADFALPEDDPWRRGLVRQWAQRSGHPALAITVQPVGYQLDATRLPAIAAGLEAALGTELGSRVSVQLLPSCNPADEAPAATVRPALALFAMTATPEAETHGRVLRHMAQAFEAARKNGAQPVDGPDVSSTTSGTAWPRLALIDESGFRRRLAPADRARRLEERRAAWRRLLEGSGHRPVFVDLDAHTGVAGPPR